MSEIDITELFELEADTYLGYTVEDGEVSISCNDLFVPAGDSVELPKHMHKEFAKSLIKLPLDRSRELTLMAWCCFATGLPAQSKSYAAEIKPYLDKIKQMKEVLK